MLDIADNSGVKSALCIRVLGKSTARGKLSRSVAGVGDIVTGGLQVKLMRQQSPLADFNRLK